ncbi:MAG: DUF2963 domain-containing protein [Vigna little leaf phytoplasma]|nr:DUF2963 domain-containing protein [Vigna little leaf phytoplasma]
MIIQSWTKDYYSKIFFTINVVLTCLILIISIFLYRYIQVKNTIIEYNKKLKSQIDNLILELKSYKSKNDETNITKFTEENGNLIQKNYHNDQKTLNYIKEFDKKDIKKIIKQTQYQADGKTINFINEYDKDNGFMIKQHRFSGFDSKNLIINQKEFDKITGKMIKFIGYFEDNPNIINFINEYDKNTGEIIKKLDIMMV